MTRTSTTNPFTGAADVSAHSPPEARRSLIAAGKFLQTTSAEAA
jgi:hypothetical protein